MSQQLSQSDLTTIAVEVNALDQRLKRMGSMANRLRRGPELSDRDCRRILERMQPISRRIDRIVRGIEAAHPDLHGALGEWSHVVANLAAARAEGDDETARNLVGRLVGLHSRIIDLLGQAGKDDEEEDDEEEDDEEAIVPGKSWRTRRKFLGTPSLVPTGADRGFAHRLRGGRGVALADPRSKSMGVDENKMCASFVITTDTPDRVGDVIAPQGIDLAAFKQNPIGLYGHGEFPLPIGRWATPDGRCTIKLEEHRATGTLYFSQRSAEAAQVFALVAEGILSACSVGFNPIEEPQQRTDNRAGQSILKGLYFPAVDLLEVSVVAIPAQAEAVAIRSYLGRGRLAGSPIGPQLRRALEPLARR